jgi:hypothetical protein
LEMRRSKAGYDISLGRIAERLRDSGESVTKEALPTRWLDLILHLDEQERRRGESRQAETKPQERRD